MGQLSTSPRMWLSAIGIAQSLSPINTIGLQTGQAASMPLAPQQPSLPGLPDPSVIEAMTDGIMARAPHAGAVQGMWKFEGSSQPPEKNGKLPAKPDKRARTLKIPIFEESSEITLDDVMDGLNRQDVNDILARIANVNSEVGSAVRMNRELSERYVTLLWLAERYTPLREGVDARVATALDIMSKELGKRLDDLCLDLMRGNRMERRAAAIVTGMIPMPAFTAGDGNAIDQITGSLVEAARETTDLAVRYDTTIALAVLAKKFYGRAGMVKLGIEALVDSMETLRHDSKYAERPVVAMLSHLSGLTDHKGTLMPPLRPDSREIKETVHIFTVLMTSGANEDVRTTAKQALDALKARLAGFIATEV